MFSFMWRIAWCGIMAFVMTWIEYFLLNLIAPCALIPVEIIAGDTAAISLTNLINHLIASGNWIFRILYTLNLLACMGWSYRRSSRNLDQGKKKTRWSFVFQLGDKMEDD